MKKILVWDCSDIDLRYAEQEKANLLALRSKDCGVVPAGQEIEWPALAGFAAAVKPTILHFIGHGDDLGQIKVNEDGSTFGRPAKDVIKVVREAAPSLEGVFLSACFSAKAGPELLKDLPTVGGWAIGTVSKVDDDLAAVFAERFYRHLLGSAATPEEAYSVAHAYTDADWPDEVPHSAWFARSPLPSIGTMARDINSALRDILNRSAFRTPMRREVSMQELDAALQDVGRAMATGQLISRQDRAVIGTFPREWLQDPEIEKFVSSATKSLAATRRALAVLKEGAVGSDRVYGNVLNFDKTARDDEWMRRVNRVDQTRNLLLKAANALFVRNNVPRLQRIDLSFSADDIKKAGERATGA
ncbi:hypothetical protein [Paenarthrobacter nicotinovorans]|uniref:hypothetical protein n=1 Tax=Paenarthrobacter nicotinovorans TaxID=29320 RepID=UPI0012DE7789|nr:hypothetical protein [Paenarthrobacter nicotinovorans]